MKAFLKDANFGISLLLILAAIGLAYVAIPTFGNKALIVRSGSMQPTIGVGDLVVVKTQKGFLSPLPTEALREGGNKYKEGDIVAFSSEKNPKLFTTHRIVATEVKDGKVFYRTKGDANKSPDQNLIAEENVIGRGVIRLPYVGRLIAFTKSNIGFPLLVIFPAMLVIIAEIVNIVREIKKQRRTIQTPFFRGSTPIRGPTPNLVITKAIIPIAIAALILPNTFAFFTDTETSTNNTFTAAESFGPPIAQTLVINEVLPDSSCSQGNTEAQWIEIYNGFNFAVNPKNYKITDGTNTIDLVTANNLTISPGGFLLLAHNSAIWGVNGCYSDNGTQTGNLGGQLNIDVGELRLIDTDGVTVLDVVRWNQAGDATPLQNQSIERVPTGLDSATGANFEPTDFVVREMPTPGYGSNLVLNEMLPNPDTTFPNEWAELYNPSGSPIDLTGWTLKDVALSARSLTPLGSINPSNWKVHDDSGDSWLNNSGPETLQLKDPSGRIIDQHTYTGSIGNDVSIGREADRGNIWKNCTTPTKGSSNNGAC